MRKIPFLVILFFSGLLSACEETAYVPQHPVSFEGTSYVLNVSAINIVEEYHSQSQPPHVEKLSDIPPAEALKQWAAARLVAGGKTGYAEVVIKDAHITKKNLPKQKSGLEGVFTAEQTEEYDGALETDIKIYDGQHVLPVASIHAVSHNSRTLAENATLVDRSNTYHEMSVELIRTLEVEMNKNIREHFEKYLM